MSEIDWLKNWGRCRLVYLVVVLATFVASTSAVTSAPPTVPVMERIADLTEADKDVLLVFSDVDGTLVHYPKKRLRSERHNSILNLPASTTGMRGVISSKTLSLVQDVRREGVKFVLISGMRTSTFLNRLPFLPRADAYCTEAGGRIFYPTTLDDSRFVVKPQKYDGCSEADMEPFSLVEDMQWRAKMESITGSYGLSDLKELAMNPGRIPPLNERDGLLWDFARHLISKGYVLDTAGYSACFRVNQKQQTTVSSDDFAALSNGQLEVWDGLGSSVNLACVDFYPATSGKKNCCQYLAEKFCPDLDENTLLRDHAVCLCDDDNDIEMANACRHAFIPDITSRNMAATIAKSPEQFTVTGGGEIGKEGPVASEAALMLILDLLRPREHETPPTGAEDGIEQQEVDR